LPRQREGKSEKAKNIRFKKEEIQCSEISSEITLGSSKIVHVVIGGASAMPNMKKKKFTVLYIWHCRGTANYNVDNFGLAQRYFRKKTFFLVGGEKK